MENGPGTHYKGNGVPGPVWTGGENLPHDGSTGGKKKCTLFLATSVVEGLLFVGGGDENF